MPVSKEKSTSSLQGELGHLAVVFEEKDIVLLLRAAVEWEGGQAAFAKRHKLDRSRISRILSGQLRTSEAIANALGLRRAYITDYLGAKLLHPR